MKRKNKFGTVKTEIYNLRGCPRIRSLKKKKVMMMMMRKKEERITFHYGSAWHYFIKQSG
jgi:hypothetical protein